MEKAKGLMTLLFSWEELCKGRGKKGWKNEVGVGLIGKSGGELTSLLSSSSSISSLMLVFGGDSSGAFLSGFMMIMTV